MIKAHMDLTRNDVLLVTLTWHEVAEDGTVLDIGYKWTDAVDDELKQRIIDVCSNPISINQRGVSIGTGYPGSSKHFENLPKHLERLGCRVRSYY